MYSRLLVLCSLAACGGATTSDPAPGTEPSSSSDGDDRGGARAPSGSTSSEGAKGDEDPLDALTCDELMASGKTSGKCPLGDLGESCSRPGSCLSCACNQGTWVCTTDPSCFGPPPDAGSGG